MTDLVRVSPLFIDNPGGKLFVTQYAPASSANRNHVIIFIPPFAEEMNRSRRMVSEQARDLAIRGFRVVVFDLFGTGDSEGDFSDARWELWVANVARIVEWATPREDDIYSIVAVRLGALLLFDSPSYLVSNARSITLWQPILTGANFMRQFLRLRMAAAMADGTTGAVRVADILNELDAGISVEVAGYMLSPKLAMAIHSANLKAAARSRELSSIHWIEIVRTEEAKMSAKSFQMVQQWRLEGASVSDHTVCGPLFWGTVETTIAPALVKLTTSLLIDGSD